MKGNFNKYLFRFRNLERKSQGYSQYPVLLLFMLSSNIRNNSIIIYLKNFGSSFNRSERNCTILFSRCRLSCNKYTGHKIFVLPNNSRAHVCISQNETECMISWWRPCANSEQCCTHFRGTKTVNTWKNQME